MVYATSFRLRFTVYRRSGQPVLYKEPKSIEAVTERAVTQLLPRTSALAARGQVADLFLSFFWRALIIMLKHDHIGKGTTTFFCRLFSKKILTWCDLSPALLTKLLNRTKLVLTKQMRVSVHKLAIHSTILRSV